MTRKDEQGNKITIAHEGDTIRYTVKIKNDGAPAKVSFEDTINSKLSIKENGVNVKLQNSDKIAPTVNKDGNKLSFTDYSLDSGATIEITIDTIVNNLPDDKYQEDIEENTAIIKSKVGNEKPEEQKPSDKTEYTVLKPHTVTTKTSKIVKCDKNMKTGTTVHAGDEIEYTITIDNDGRDSDIIKTITDTIPRYLTYVNDSLNVSVTDGEAIPEIVMTEDNRELKLNSQYTLNAGKTITIKFKVSVDAMPEGTYSRKISKNIVYVNGTPAPDKDYTEEAPQVRSSKSVSKSKVEYGDEVEYKITVENISKGDIEAKVDISDPLPKGIDYIPGSITVNEKSIEDNGHYDKDAGENGTITYNTTLKKSGDTLTLKFKATITEKVIGKSIKNIATINGEDKDATTKVIKKTEVTVVSTKINPIDLVLVLDHSGSMKEEVNGTRKIDDLISQAKQLVDKVFPEGTETESTITMISYSNSATNGTTYKYADKERLKKAIDNLKNPDGGTNIYDALAKAKSSVSGLTGNRDAVVVFLTDGSPTAPFAERDLVTQGIYTENYSTSSSTPFTNNTKKSIEAIADELKDLSRVKKVYSIGLGVSSLSTTKVGYAEMCESITGTVEFDTKNHTYTVKLDNPSNKEVTVETVKARIIYADNVKSDNGTVKKNDDWDFTITWNNLKVPAKGLTITGSYTPAYYHGYEITSYLDGEVEVEKVCLNEEHKEDLFSITKTGKDGNLYHCITQQDYANYILNKITTEEDGAMNVSQVSDAFDDLIRKFGTKTKTYEIEKGTVIEIPETREITSKVKVTIGSNSNEYTLKELEQGKDGLIYKSGEGFEWTMTDDTLLTEKLSLGYDVKE